MLQAVMNSPGKIEFRDVLKPIPQANEVLIKVKRIGICGSDIHVYHGMHPYTDYPIVQGHEVSGIIAEVGANVKNLFPGDPVVFMPQITCGECYPCRNGMYNICDSLKVIGFQANGAAQEFFPIPADKVLKLPSTITLDHAAMIEPLSVAMHAVNLVGDIEGKNVLVLGAGTIGNFVGQVAKAKGANKVLITDISDFKLKIANLCGLRFGVNPQNYDLSEVILQIFGHEKADFIFECVGVEDTIGQAISLSRKGSLIIIVGVFGRKPVIDIGLVQDHELKLVGSLMYKKEDYQDAITLLNQGKLLLDPLITNQFPFKEFTHAYEFIENSKGNALKVLVCLD